ncbi:ATP-binding protein [Limimaricola cinnabarinus]|uniref:histidine kinase n=1 Tax=Limimaricola cinnabarinus TaxID=1125964 RepID=A0A2G1MFB2_9RHOB|nr:ATP-binding protein [Limimaricola cinnabarinus]PHP27394.1 histidine kinase [Limimaricola cinnabarinus]
MTSIRVRLFAILLAATGAVWLSAVWWIQHSTRAEVEQVLDARLAEAAQMVSSLISDRRIDVTTAGPVARDLPVPAAGADYARQLSCQIWSLDGALLGASASAPSGRLAAEQTGFSDSLVDGEAWRVYTMINEDLGLRVMVGDRLTVRDRLVADVARGLLLPALAILPVLAALIWISVGRGLAPLGRMARALGQRAAEDLGPVAAGPLPREIRPMGAALDGLFARVAAARAREKSFTAFAAHELKTPLAGIKTQAQIAAMAPDEATRRQALARIESGVARTDRMVRQLLELAAVDGAPAGGGEVIDVTRLVSDLAQDMQRLAAGREVRLVLKVAPGLFCRIPDPVLPAVALRNIVENAVLASPAGEEVVIEGVARDARITLSVLDRGPGIPEAERTRVTERFFRGTSAPAGGSGLGLAIAQVAVERLGGRLGFAPRTGGGEAVRIALPCAGPDRESGRTPKGKDAAARA